MEPRVPKKQEWPDIHQFLQKRLRQDVNWTLRDEYPLAFEEKNLGNIRIISDDDNKIISHTVLKTHLIKTHYSLFRVGFIGSVCTEQIYQGKGYGRANVESCLQAAEAQACDFVMLWTNLFEYYEKMGFAIGGSEIAMNIPKTFNYQSENLYKIVEGPQVSTSALLNAYNKHNLRTLRSNTDITKYLKIPNSRILTAWNSTTGKIMGYIVIGKGGDFSNHIHEWGGTVSSIMSLIQHALPEHEDLTIIMPPQCQNLRRQLSEQGCQENQGVLGMINIVNPAALCKKIKKAARSMGFEDLVFDYRDGKYYFGHGDEIYQTDSNKDMVRLIFGPMTPDQIHDFGTKTMEVFKEVFPIPFWVWGWDSI